MVPCVGRREPPGADREDIRCTHEPSVGTRASGWIAPETPCGQPGTGAWQLVALVRWPTPKGLPPVRPSSYIAGSYRRPRLPEVSRILGTPPRRAPSRASGPWLPAAHRCTGAAAVWGIASPAGPCGSWVARFAAWGLDVTGASVCAWPAAQPATVPCSIAVNGVRPWVRGDPPDLDGDCTQ